MSHKNMTASGCSSRSVKIKAPTVSAISPISGAAAGGTPVTVTGTNFKKSANPNLKVGGVNCTSVVVVNATTMTGVTGAHGAAASLPVLVTNDNTGDGYSLGSGTSGNGLYEYT